MSQTRILIVHPDSSARTLIGSMLQASGHQVEEAANDPEAIRSVEQGGVGLVVLGSDSLRDDWLDLLAHARRKHPRVPVILLLRDPQPDRVREATQWGVASVLRFPLPATHLRAAVAQALGVTEAPPATNGHRNGHNGQPDAAARPPARPAPAERRDPPGLLGHDPLLRQAIELATMIAPTRAPVLIVGERGTGKSQLARWLHQSGPRRAGPFVEVDCAALPETALELELFGLRGPNGTGDRPGALTRAAGGTLLLNEVAALSPALQFKLLRVLQEGEFEPVGSGQTARTDVRLVVASREDLAGLIEWGWFRQDLYYRLNVVSLTLPPLRQRGDDVLLLAEHFRARAARELDRAVTGFTPEAAALLRRHNWPGNVLELENAVERAALLARGGRIDAAHLDLQRREPPPRPAPPPAVAVHRHQLTPPAPAAATPSILPLKEALEGPEKQLILQALEALNWNRQETARVLDINRTTLYKKMKKYGLLCDEPAWVN